MRTYKKHNTKNLIQFDEMPPEYHKELSARGGKASGEARRKKKAIQDIAYTTFEYYACIENLSDEFDEFLKWKKRREKARANRERTKKKRR